MVKIRNLCIEDSCLLSHLKNHFLLDAQEVAETRFQAYQQHELKGDFILARYDTQVIFTIWWYMGVAQSLDLFHYHELTQPASFFPNPYADLVGAMVVALAGSSVMIYYKSRSDKQYKNLSTMLVSELTWWC
jgi:hypothetical protein